MTVGEFTAKARQRLAPYKARALARARTLAWKSAALLQRFGIGGAASRTSAWAPDKTIALSVALLGEPTNPKDALALSFLAPARQASKFARRPSFERRVLDALLAGGPIPHDSSGVRFGPIHAEVLSAAFGLDDAQQQRLGAQTDWRSALAFIFDAPGAFDFIFAELDEKDRDIVRLKLSLAPRVLRGLFPALLTVTPEGSDVVLSLGSGSYTLEGARLPDGRELKIASPGQQARLKVQDAAAAPSLTALLRQTNNEEVLHWPVRTRLPALERQRVLAVQTKALRLLSGAEALTDLQAEFRAWPLDPDVRYLLAEACAWTGDFFRAADLLAPPFDDDGKACVARVGALLRLGRYDEARDASAKMAASDAYARALHQAAEARARGAAAPCAASAYVLSALEGGLAPRAGLASALGDLQASDGEVAANLLALVFASPAQFEQLLQSEPVRTQPKLVALLPDGVRTAVAACLSIDAVSDWRTQLDCARLHLRNREPTRGLPYARAARAARPGELEPMVIEAQLLRLSDSSADKAAAAAIFKQLLQADPNNVRYADFYLQLERGLAIADPLRDANVVIEANKRLLEERTRAVASAPHDRTARLDLAKLYVGLERYRQAREILESLHEPSAIDLEVLRPLIDCCERENDRVAAAQYAEQVLAVSFQEFAALALVRSLRVIGRSDEIFALAEHWKGQIGARLAYEIARTHFFLGDFKTASAETFRLLELYPTATDLRVLAIATALEKRDFATAERILDALTPSHAEFLHIESLLFRYALAYGRGDFVAATEHLNQVFRLFGCQDVAAPDGDTPMFDRFTPAGAAALNGDVIGPPPVFDGPLVTVVMTAYNAEAHIETAVRSIMQQSYRNIELIVVDDASSDGTPQKLEALERTWPNMRAVLKTTNDGTYVSKNTGILQARGEFIALQDSDDWSHPDRIAKSVAVLLSRPDIVGLTTDWIRMTTEGAAVIKAGGQISHVCCISLVFRREPALRKIGFFDSVRIEADMEYIRRMTLVFGTRAVVRLRWPLLLGRSHAASLTENQEFGIARTGFTTPRIEYQAAYKKWHSTIEAGADTGHVSFPLERRRYPAPAIILPERKSA